MQNFLFSAILVDFRNHPKKEWYRKFGEPSANQS